MAQAGLHAIVGAAVRKWMPKKEWVLLGVILGSIFPDLDNLVVAYATLAKLPDPGHYHRTFTHSIVVMIVLVELFYVITTVTKKASWRNFGQGFGLGILLHVFLDLVLWFNGVVLLWPINYELNLWGWFVTPGWLKILLDTGEFLMLGFYFMLLSSLARKQNTDADRQGANTMWAYLQFALFLLFTLIFFVMGAKGLQYTIYGALYLLSIILAMVVTVRMRKTVEAI